MRMTLFFHRFKGTISVIILCLILAGTACNKFTEGSYGAADVRHFGFDSFPDYEDYTFYIDNFKNVIYNEDSFPFLSEIDSIYPCITVVSTNNEIYFNDTLWKTGQIVDFNVTPMILRNTSEDGQYTKTYQIHINVHQVDPDSMIMNVFSTKYPDVAKKQKILATDKGFTTFFQLKDGSLIAYSSTDGTEWNASSPALTGLTGSFDVLTLNAFNDNYYIAAEDGRMFKSSNLADWSVVTDTTPVTTLFGTLTGRKYLSDDALIGIVTDTVGQKRFARYDTAWTLGEIIPEDFPIDAYAVTENKTVTDVYYYLVSTGLNAKGTYSQGTYSTMDGLHWATVKNTTSTVTPREGASIFYYDGRLFLYGGENQGGNLDTTLYISKDHGLSWETAESKLQFKNIKTGLSYQQILIDDKYIRIFGGNSYEEDFRSVWKGYINEMLF